MPFGWGIATTGKHPDIKIAPAMAVAGGGELVGVYSRDQRRAEAFAQKHDARAAYSQLGDLLGDSRLDGVFVCSERGRHKAPSVEEERVEMDVQVQSSAEPLDDSAIGFSGMEIETVCRYQLPVKIVVFNNGGIGPGHEEMPENPLHNLRPNALIYGARYDKMMEAFGGKGWFIEDPKDLKAALQDAMAFKGPALVNVRISQGSARKPQQLGWHS